MPRAYSVDIRERASARRDVGHADGRGRPSLRRQCLQPVSLAPSPGRTSGHPRAIGPAAEAALRAQVAAAPDATLAEHCAQWQADRGEVVGVAAMYRALGRLGVTRKKDPDRHGAQ